jgi:hypothetical protein
MRHLLALTIVALIATSAPAQAAPVSTIYTAIVTCAPHVDHGIIVGILERESAVSPWEQLDPSSSNFWQINDNTERRSYAYRTYIAAVQDTDYRVNRQHHVVAIGIGQILSDNLAHLHVDVAQALQPCTNLSLAQNVLIWAYTIATTSLHIQPGLQATHIALQLYYAGLRDQRFRQPDAIAYADDVMQIAAHFNAGHNAIPLAVIATLPMPEHPWPSGASVLPYIPPAALSVPHTAPPPSTAEAYRARLQAIADRDQRRLNSYFTQGPHQ